MAKQMIEKASLRAKQSKASSRAVTRANTLLARRPSSFGLGRVCQLHHDKISLLLYSTQFSRFDIKYFFLGSPQANMSAPTVPLSLVFQPSVGQLIAVALHL